MGNPGDKETPAPYSAFILAVGTELTSGQVTNRNAAWLSERLTDLGFAVVLHETVPDDRILIREALERGANLARFQFVTGGLGPTSDDFTREVIAQWLGSPLEYHAPSWDHIVARLTAFNVPVAESNRQQCYFPRGAQVIPNPQGTANAFGCPHARGQLWCFPGPPVELAAVWDGGICTSLREVVPTSDRTQLFRWSCMGKSEAQLGEIVEAALEGSGFQTGYRAHMPYIEIKVWVPERELDVFPPWRTKLERAIEPWVVATQGEDLADRFLRAVSAGITIWDDGTDGVLAERLWTRIRTSPELAPRPFTVVARGFTAVSDAVEERATSPFLLQIGKISAEGVCHARLSRSGALIWEKTLESPYRVEKLRDRNRRYMTEVVIRLSEKALRDESTS
ncbi:MAG: competence/damage-inducible protein A [Bacteriovoracia bacterium]